MGIVLVKQIQGKRRIKEHVFLFPGGGHGEPQLASVLVTDHMDEAVKVLEQVLVSR